MAQSAPADPATVPARSAAEPLLARLNARGFRLLMPLDALMVAVALVLPMVARHGLSWPSYPAWAYGAAYVGIVALHVLVLYFAGLYERSHRLGHRPVLPRVVGGTTGAMLLVALGELLSGVYLVPRGNLPFVLVLSALGVTANRALSRRLQDRRMGPPRVLLVGSDEEAALASQHLALATQRTEVVGATSTIEGLAGAVVEHDATDVLLLSGRGLDGIYPEPLTFLEEAGVGVLQRITPRDTLLGLRAVREVAGMPCVPLRTHALPRSSARAKRTLELALLALAAPLALPALLFLAAYVRAVAGSPVLFRQERVGLGAQRFLMVKFRTMVRDADRGGTVVPATKDDPRVVGGCRWLRAMRLDELPQLLNVLRGEMSLVGPRPEHPDLVRGYERVNPGYHRRHEIPPGLTGLAQVQGRYDTDASYKLGHDLQYLVNWSPVLDLQILARTVWVVLSRKS